jgi:hypothetical protein
VLYPTELRGRVRDATPLFPGPRSSWLKLSSQPQQRTRAERMPEAQGRWDEPNPTACLAWLPGSNKSRQPQGERVDMVLATPSIKRRTGRWNPCENQSNASGTRKGQILDTASVLVYEKRCSLSIHLISKSVAKFD